MFKRLVRRAIATAQLEPAAVAVATDDGLIHDLMERNTTGLARRLRERRLAKRALDLPATELPAATPGWPGEDPDLLEQVEDRLALELHLEPGELFLDFPAKADMLALELPLVKRDGDRKSTRLNSSHGYISYAVFCLKKKKEERTERP